MGDFIVALALLVPAAALGVWANEHAKRPKLVIEGYGVQSGPAASGQPSLMTLRISNVPGFMGVRLQKTIILGKVVHGFIEKGTTVERRPAKGVRVAFFEDDSLGGGFPLWMLPQEGDEPGAPTQSTSLASGQSAIVYVVGRRPSDNGYSMGVHPDWVGGGEPTTHQVANYAEPRAFTVRAWADRVGAVGYTFRVVRGSDERWAIERVTKTEQSRSPF